MEMIVWHYVLAKFKDTFFKICTYFKSKMTKQWKYGGKKCLLRRSFTFNNTFLNNEARTQKYFFLYKAWKAHCDTPVHKFVLRESQAISKLF